MSADILRWAGSLLRAPANGGQVAISAEISFQFTDENCGYTVANAVGDSAGLAQFENKLVSDGRLVPEDFRI
jgi:hypothetical protein